MGDCKTHSNAIVLKILYQSNCPSWDRTAIWFGSTGRGDDVLNGHGHAGGGRVDDVGQLPEKSVSAPRIHHRGHRPDRGRGADGVGIPATTKSAVLLLRPVLVTPRFVLERAERSGEILFRTGTED